MHVNKNIKIVAVSLLSMLSYSVQSECFYSGIRATAPDSRYNDNKDGTVTDKRTGLVWKQCSEGRLSTNIACDSGNDSKFFWKDALAQSNIANSDKFAGATNWRLPNIKELLSLNEYACRRPTINLNYFPNTPTIVGSRYWSSSTLVSGFTIPGQQAWAVRIDNGEAFYKDKDAFLYHVRLVRDVN